MYTSILLPATRCGFRAKRFFFPVADNVNSGFFDSQIYQIFLHGLSPAFPQFQVVLHGPVFITMSFDQHAGILVHMLEEFSILFQDGDGTGTNRKFVKIKKDIGQP